MEGIIRKPVGANVAFLLVHGFCTDYDELASLGELLESEGMASFAVRLAGHGSSPEDLATTTWKDWYDSVESAYREVQSWNVQHVFVAGLSMGAALTLYLATREPTIDGIVIISPAIKVGGLLGKLVPIIRMFKKYRAVDLSYIPKMYDLPRTRYDREPLSALQELLRFTGEVRKVLHEVTVPILVVKAGADKTVNPTNSDYVYDNVASPQKEIVTIDGAEHVITCHPTRKEAYPHILRFINEVILGN